MLTALILENFQSIKKETIIPIRPLTFFYGPNSAGKSSIFDALELLKTYFDPCKNDAEIEAMLNRWARRENPHEYSKYCKVGFILKINGDQTDIVSHMDLYEYYLPNGHSINIDESPFPLEDKELKVFITFKFDTDLVEEHGFFGACRWVTNKIEISLDNKSVLQLKSIPGKLELGEDIYQLELALKDWLAPWINTIISTDKKIKQNILENINFDHAGAKISTKIGVPSAYHFTHIKPLLFAPSKDTFSTDFIKTFVDFILLTGYLLAVCTEGDLPMVSGDRSIFKKSDTVLLVKGTSVRNNKGDGYGEGLNSEYSILNQFFIKNDANLKWLAQMVAHKAVSKLIKEEYGENYTTWPNFQALDTVNRYLSDDFFQNSDYGYQITGYVQSLSQLESTADLDLSIHEKIVKLFLIDNKGIRHELQDVGSGLSFVIPVLCVSASKGIGLIQQPELHLHPALQSSLGDVFISSLRNRLLDENVYPLIIETHSEHLLLRVLKKFRTSNSIENVEGVFDPESISILYFEPTYENGTKIKRIRLTQSGDFIDNWPNGFFTERYKDVFDD